MSHQPYNPHPTKLDIACMAFLAILYFSVIEIISRSANTLIIPLECQQDCIQTTYLHHNSNYISSDGFLCTYNGDGHLKSIRKYITPSELFDCRVMYAENGGVLDVTLGKLKDGRNLQLRRY